MSCVGRANCINNPTTWNNPGKEGLSTAKRIWELLSVPPKITCPVQEEEGRIRANPELLKKELFPKP